MTANNEATEILLVPHPDTLEAAFEITGVKSGVHKVKVVTESRLGVSQGLAAATEHVLTVIGVPPIEAPTNIVVYKDGGAKRQIQIEIPTRDHIVGESIRYRIDIYSTTVDGTFTADASTNQLTSVGNTLVDGDYIALSTDGTLPAPLLKQDHFYVRDKSGDTFRVAKRAGDSAVDLTDTGTGTHSFSKRKRSMAIAESVFQPSVFTVYQFSDTMTPPGGKGGSGSVAEWKHTITEGTGGWLRTFTSPYTEKNDATPAGSSVLNQDGSLTCYAFGQFDEPGSLDVDFDLVVLPVKKPATAFVQITSPVNYTSDAEPGGTVYFQMKFINTELAGTAHRWYLEIWERIAGTLTKTFPPSTPWPAEMPGWRYKIQSVGSELRFYRNYHGAGSTPFHRTQAFVVFPLMMRMTIDDDHRLLDVRTKRSNHVTSYPNEDARFDFGLGPTDPLPTSIRYRVYEERLYNGLVYLGPATDFTT